MTYPRLPHTYEPLSPVSLSTTRDRASRLVGACAGEHAGRVPAGRRSGRRRDRTRCDLTRDGHVVVMHDATIDRTTDGQGRVDRSDAGGDRQVDAGAWKSAEFKGEHVPLLEEVFEAVGQRVLINVEIKSTTLRGNGLEAKVSALIREARSDRSSDHLVVQSARPATVKQIDARLACGLLYSPDQPIYLRDAWLAPLIPHLNARHPHRSPSTRPWSSRFTRTARRSMCGRLITLASSARWTTPASMG